jgi:Na+/H+ antiporter NhaA
LVNSGLMTFFFFVVGLEARREFDLGELRQRRRATLPVLAGIGGMTVPVVIFLALNAGRDSAAGWGVTMYTDTAFALGLLALVARGLPDRVRIFLLTVVVVDDLVALLVIATVYSGPAAPGPLLLALGILGGILLLRLARIAAPRPPTPRGTRAGRRAYRPAMAHRPDCRPHVPRRPH